MKLIRGPGSPENMDGRKAGPQMQQNFRMKEKLIWDSTPLAAVTEKELGRTK